jgi:hypothetical protein
LYFSITRASHFCNCYINILLCLLQLTSETKRTYLISTRISAYLLFLPLFTQLHPHQTKYLQKSRRYIQDLYSEIHRIQKKRKGFHFLSKLKDKAFGDLTNHPELSSPGTPNDSAKKKKRAKTPKTPKIQTPSEPVEEFVVPAAAHSLVRLCFTKSNFFRSPLLRTLFNPRRDSKRNFSD